MRRQCCFHKAVLPAIENLFAARLEILPLTMRSQPINTSFSKVRFRQLVVARLSVLRGSS